MAALGLALPHKVFSWSPISSDLVVIWLRIRRGHILLLSNLRRLVCDGFFVVCDGRNLSPFSRAPLSVPWWASRCGVWHWKLQSPSVQVDRTHTVTWWIQQHNISWLKLQLPGRAMCSGTAAPTLRLAAPSTATVGPRFRFLSSRSILQMSPHFLSNDMHTHNANVSCWAISVSSCRTQEEWWAGSYRDCNGESNGTPLPQVIVWL